MYTWVICYDGFIFGVIAFEYRNIAGIKSQPSLKDSCSEKRVSIHWNEEIPLQISLNSSVNANAYAHTKHVNICSTK